jgi:hypothetical protein
LPSTIATAPYGHLFEHVDFDGGRESPQEVRLAFGDDRSRKFLHEL